MNQTALSSLSVCRAFLFLLTLSCCLMVQGQDVVVNRFDTPEETNRWPFNYGTPSTITNAISFSQDDALSQAASGSILFEVAYGPGSQQAAFTASLTSPLDGNTVTSLELDVKVAPGSALDRFGNAVYFQVAVRNGGSFTYNKVFEGNFSPASTNNGWRHIVISPLTGAINDIRGLTLDLYDSNYTNFNGMTRILVDNIVFTRANTNPPPPRLAIEKATPGLNLIPLGVNNRESIAALNADLGWIGSAEPVTYSFTVTEYPGPSHTPFQTHLFLDAANGAGPDVYADFNRTNVVFLDIQNQANGSVYAAFRYKTNEPRNNNFLYSGGTLGGVSSPSALGTWSLTFSQDTNVTLAAPNGALFSTNLPPEAAALFAGPINLMLGAQANSSAVVGQRAVIGDFRATRGATVLVEDNFREDSELDQTKWQVAAVDPTSVVLAGPESLFWVSWTLPDTGFSLSVNFTSITDPNAWTPMSLPATAFGTTRRVLVWRSDLSNTNFGFFRLNAVQ